MDSIPGRDIPKSLGTQTYEVELGLADPVSG